MNKHFFILLTALAMSSMQAGPKFDQALASEKKEALSLLVTQLEETKNAHPYSLINPPYLPEAGTGTDGKARSTRGLRIALYEIYGELEPAHDKYVLIDKYIDKLKAKIDEKK